MYLAAFLICFVALFLYGLPEAMPWSVVDCVIPLFFLACLGIGVGLTSSAISYYIPLWSWIWSRISRMLIFTSGVFYIADKMQYRIREIIVWNPILHAIDWFRIGLYGNYPDFILDKHYLISWSVGSLLVGIVAHSGSLRRTPWKK